MTQLSEAEVERRARFEDRDDDGVTCEGCGARVARKGSLRGEDGERYCSDECCRAAQRVLPANDAQACIPRHREIIH